jgi:hypothetical protein
VYGSRVSDGGAQVIVQAVSFLARFRLGRILLLAVVVLLIFRGLASSIGISPWILLGVIGAGWAAFAAAVAIHRRRRERASFRQMLLFVGFILVASLGALLLLLRRRKQAAATAPPDPREIEELSAALLVPPPARPR